MNAPFRAPSPQAHPPVLIWIAATCALFEGVFTLTDSPLVGMPGLRSMAMVYGAFWPGLLEGWTPVFPGQQASMFLSYAFLHGGFLHMLFNMLILLQLGREAVARLGTPGFLLLYALSAAGGGAGFALLSAGDSPMLGASGAIFGLFGATIFWDAQRRRAAGVSLEQPLRLIGGLVVLNVLLWALVGGMLAWQAHLGGFMTGALVAWLVTPSLGHRHRPARRGPGGKR